MKGIVAILGASDKPRRYAYKAMKALESRGEEFRLVNPRLGHVDGHECVGCIKEIGEPIDTVTVYLRPENLRDVVGGVAFARPRRVILNPGAEDPVSRKVLEEEGIEVVEACTLVMLSTSQF